MRIKLFAGLVAATVTNALVTAAPAPAPMAPTGPWQVEFADSMCLLSRPYGKNGGTNLIFKPGMIGKEFEIIVTTPASSISRGTWGKATLRTGGNMPLGEASFSAYSTAKGRMIRIRTGDDKLTLPAIRSTLSIDAEKESRHLFDVPELERALPVLAQCLKQLREDYKVSDADIVAIATEP